MYLRRSRGLVHFQVPSMVFSHEGLSPVWGTSLWSRGTAWRERNNRDKVLREDHNTDSSSCCAACWVRSEVEHCKKREWWKFMFSFGFISWYSTALLLIGSKLNLFSQIVFVPLIFLQCTKKPSIRSSIFPAVSFQYHMSGSSPWTSHRMNISGNAEFKHAL